MITAELDQTRVAVLIDAAIHALPQHCPVPAPPPQSEAFAGVMGVWVHGA